MPHFEQEEIDKILDYVNKSDRQVRIFAKMIEIFATEYSITAESYETAKAIAEQIVDKEDERKKKESA